MGKESPIYKNLEGSGSRALQENDRALEEARAALRDVNTRVDRGEDVPMDERRAALERIKRLEEDRGRIELAGV